VAFKFVQNLDELHIWLMMATKDSLNLDNQKSLDYYLDKLDKSFAIKLVRLATKL
jgi:hypothetical protein